jgi:hypothetical protein
VDDTGMAVAASNSTTATATTFNGNFTASSNTANSAFVKVASNDRPSTCQHCNHDWHAMRPCKHEGCQCGNVEGLGTPFASKKPMNPWTEKDEAKAEENETEGRDNPEYMWRHAIGETVVPADVDTLRDSTCPICGEQDSYDGETCAVCNFVNPPDELMDPDLTKAKDLRELQDAQEDTAAPGESPDGQPQDFSMTKEEEGEELGEGFSFKEPGAQDVPEEGDPEEVPVDEVDVSVSETEDPNGDHHNGPDSGFSFQPKERETEVSVEVDSPEAEAESEEEKDSDEDDEEDDDRKKKFNPSKAARGHRRIVDPQESEMRTALRLLAEQQVQLDAEKRAISLIASKLDMRPAVAQIRGEATKRIAALRAEADAENPAQPIPSEGSEAPAATTEETLGDLNADSVETPGATSETDVAPDATTSVDSVGEDVPAPEAANQDVTKAVQGTEGPRPTEEVRIETDVKAQDGVNTDTAFPLEGDFATEVKISSGRQFAALRLAKARIAAHVAESDDDLVEGTKIATSDMSDEAIASEISVLEKVVEASAKTAAAAPQRTASRQPTRRATPSMSGGLASAGVGSGGAALGGDEFLFD